MTLQTSGAPQAARETRSRTAMTAAVLGLLLTGVGLMATPAAAKPVLAPDGSGFIDSSRVLVHHGERYCWYAFGWRDAGWYVCGQNQLWGHGWWGPRHPLHIPRPHHHHPRPPHGPGPVRPPASPPGTPPHPPGPPHGGPRPGR